MRIRPAIKTHGGKFYLASWVIEHFPKNYEELIYCEPFCAGASIFLNKEPSSEEIINDIDHGVVYVLKALRDEPQEFIGRVRRTRYTQRTFQMAQTRAESGFDDYIDHAVNEYILRRMSRGGLKKAFAWSNRMRGGQPGDLNAWKTMIKLLPEIAKRLEGVNILCEDFKSVIKVWDEENTLTYLDPPYLHSTRSEGATEIYENELTVEDHMDMLHLAQNVRGKVIISGYSSPLYNRTLKGWKVRRKNVANHSSQTKKKDRRLECIWYNY